MSRTFKYSFTKTETLLHSFTVSFNFVFDKCEKKWLHLLRFFAVWNTFRKYTTGYVTFIHLSVQCKKCVKGTLMQIWKFANIFTFIWKWYVDDFILKHRFFFVFFFRSARVRYVKFCLQRFRNNRVC